MSYKVVEIQETDHNKICELYNKGFGKPMSNYNSSKIFSWLFFNNIYKKNYCRGLHNGEEFSAYWGFIPIDCIIKNKILKGSLSFQLVSNQEVLGASLLLWKKIKREILTDGVELSFTINNENSSLLLKKMGWKVKSTPILINIVHPLILINDFLCKTVSNRTIKKIFGGFFRFSDNLLSKLTVLFHNNCNNVFEVNYFDENYNELWKIVSKTINFGVNLDIRYINWRYLDKPNNTYNILSYMESDKVLGYLIYETKKDFGTYVGYIMDIIADPKNEKVVISLIRCAKKRLFQKGVTIISALSFNENIYYRFFKNSGFFNVPKKFLPHKSYFSIYKNNESENHFNLNEWNISWGNHDNL